MNKQLVISVKNDIRSDARVQKVCETLHQNQYQITVICLHDSLRFTAEFPYKIYFIKTHFNRGFLFFAEFSIRLFFALFKVQARNKLLLANDLDTLLPSVLFKMLFQNTLVYDSHEIFTELPQIKRKSVKKFWKKLERFCIRYVDKMYTVNQSLQHWFLDTYSIKSEIIQNVPRLISEFDSEDAIYQLPENFIIYQGIVKEDRGIELMCKALELIPKVHFVIVGNGDFKPKLQELCKSLSCGNRIVFIEKVSPSDLRNITKKAIAGISFESQKSLSYQLSLPNKFFDYIHAEIPVLMTDLQEYKAILQEYKVGEMLENVTSEQISKSFQNILQHRDLYVSECQKCKQQYNWQRQEARLLEIFQ